MPKLTNTKTNVEFFGSDEFLKKIQQLDGDIVQAMGQALNKSLEPVKADMEAFIKKHHYSGRTEQSLEKHGIYNKRDKTIVAWCGFNYKKGGMGAIYLNLGGLHNEPTFFVQDIIDKNLDKMHRIQNEALAEVIRGL